MAADQFGQSRNSYQAVVQCPSSEQATLTEAQAGQAEHEQPYPLYNKGHTARSSPSSILFSYPARKSIYLNKINPGSQ
jgi:hypothetical protein